MAHEKEAQKAERTAKAGRGEGEMRRGTIGIKNEHETFGVTMVVKLSQDGGKDGEDGIQPATR